MQAYRTHFELGLQRIGIDGVVGQGVDGQVFAVFVVPVERHETTAGPHPVGDDRGQLRAAAPRLQLDGLVADDIQGCRVDRMDLDERPAVELVERVDLACLGHGVPLVLQSSGVETVDIVVGQFARNPCVAGRESPRRDGVAKANRGAWPFSSTKMLWLTPSLR